MTMLGERETKNKGREKIPNTKQGVGVMHMKRYTEGGQWCPGRTLNGVKHGQTVHTRIPESLVIACIHQPCSQSLRLRASGTLNPKTLKESHAYNSQGYGF